MKIDPERRACIHCHPSCNTIRRHLLQFVSYRVNNYQYLPFRYKQPSTAESDPLNKHNAVQYASQRPRSLLFLHLADTLRGRHGVTRIEDIRKLRSSDGIMRSPMTGLSPFESTMVVLHRRPCLRFDSSVTPIWFDAPGIRFHDFWTGRIEWMGQIFHMTHIRGMAHVIGNIVENRRKSAKIPSARHAQRST